MAEVVHDAQQDFWRPPVVSEDVREVATPATAAMAEACTRCGSEFMIGARFCHTCGTRRPVADLTADARGAAVRHLWNGGLSWVQTVVADFSWRKIPVPSWLHYLHFHEIKRRVGLPTGSLIAFLVGLGCVTGAIGVSLFYRASNFAEFQAIQMWRLEWLLGATASFVAGILLKKPTDGDNN